MKCLSKHITYVGKINADVTGKKEIKQDLECKCNEVALLMVFCFNIPLMERRCKYISAVANNFDQHMSINKSMRKKVRIIVNHYLKWHL